MSNRSCSQCGDSATFSLCHLISTVAVTPRRQKCGTATLYCFACIQRVVELLRASGHSALRGLSQPLSEAYTALGAASKQDSDGRMERES